MTTTVPALHRRVLLKRDDIVALCRRFGVLSPELFGSAAVGLFDPFTSDYDFLVTYPDGYDYGPWAGCLQGIADELTWTMGRPIDLVDERTLKPGPRANVDASRVVIFDVSADA